MKHSKSFKSIRSKFSIYIVLVISVFFIVTVIFDYYNRSQIEHVKLDEELEIIANYSQIALTDPLWNFDNLGIESIMNAIFTNSDVGYVRVSGSDNYQEFIQVNEGEKFAESLMDYIERDIIKDNKIIGHIKIGISKFTTQEQIKNEIRWSVVKLLILGVLMILTIAFISKKITDPLLLLRLRTEEIAAGDLSTEIVIKTNDEVGVLATSINKMQVKLKNNFDTIHEKNDEILVFNQALEETVKKRTENLKYTVLELEETQELLVESKRLAALGELVSGLAHEMNTPLGVCVTSNSFISKNNVDLRHRYEDNKLTKNEFERSLDKIYSSTQLINSSLIRVTELINQFKKLSGDIDNEKERKFSLKNILDVIALTFKPDNSKKSISVIFETQEADILSSNMGAFNDIFTHLMSNSFAHAFKYKESGEINVLSFIDNKNLHIVYKDNGDGISESNVKKIFDPFYTTTRNSGGIGLGLSIVLNTISSFGGTVLCTSKLGIGTSFHITLPITVENNILITKNQNHK